MLSQVEPCVKTAMDQSVRYVILKSTTLTSCIESEKLTSCIHFAVITNLFACVISFSPLVSHLLTSLFSLFQFGDCNCACNCAVPECNSINCICFTIDLGGGSAQQQQQMTQQQLQQQIQQLQQLQWQQQQQFPQQPPYPR